MTVITARIIVAADGAVSVTTPLPAGEYEAVITRTDARPSRSVLELPVHDGPWDDSISLRREDIYGDDGR